MDILRLKGLQFYGRHGTEFWEKETGCRFIVDLELACDLMTSALSDRLEDTLDYRVIYSRARQVVETESHNLIERLAGRLMQEMFRTFPIAAATIRVAKTEARIGGLNEAVQIELTRTREAFEAELAHAAQAEPRKAEQNP